jgi:undecaprenyl-diphosphatase
MFEILGRFDGPAVIWLCHRRRRWMNMLMKGATRIGDGYLWAILGLGAGLVWRDGLVITGQLAVAFILELSAYKIIKARFSRPRPFVDIPVVTFLVPPPDEFSFPSGHTAAAFVALVVLGAHSVSFGLILLPLALAIGISRVYLGVHYPSDVVAGALLGGICGFAGLVVGQ